MKGLKALGGFSAMSLSQCFPNLLCLSNRRNKEEQVSQEVHSGAGTAAGAQPLLEKREGPGAVQ